MIINTENLNKFIETLEKSNQMILTAKEGSIEYEMYRNSLVKSFEMSLEQAAKLLKKRISPFFESNKAVDKLNFKDIFRHAHKYSLISEEELERWFQYRDNRNNTAHDYGINFAKETLSLIQNFLKDVKNLEKVIVNE